jgi:hypothetical protein
MSTPRKVRIGEDVGEWAEEFREAALQIPPSWRERAKKKLRAINISAPGEDAVWVRSILDAYATSYAKKAEQMRVSSVRKQRGAWMSKLVASTTDEELDTLVDALVGDPGCSPVVVVPESS